MVEADQFRDMFEERWSAHAPQIQALSVSSGVRVFTEEQLRGAAAEIQSHAHVAPTGARPNRMQHLAAPKASSTGMQKKAAVGLEGSGKSTEGSACSSLEGRRSSLGSGQFKPQHEMPKEEDLNNWSHHFKVDTVEDEYLKKATQGTDLVSFVFGLKVTWDLTQKQGLLDGERDVEDRGRREQQLKEAQGRVGEKLVKKKKKKDASESTGPDHGGLLETPSGDATDGEQVTDGERNAAASGGSTVLKSAQATGGEPKVLKKPVFGKAPKKVSADPSAVAAPVEPSAAQAAVEATSPEPLSTHGKVECMQCTFINKPKATKCAVRRTLSSMFRCDTHFSCCADMWLAATKTTLG